MIRYAPIYAGLYLRTHFWPWPLLWGLLWAGLGIGFTDGMDWAGGPHTPMAILSIVSYCFAVVAICPALIRDFDYNGASKDFRRALRDSKFNERDKKIVSIPQGNSVNVYETWHGVNGGKQKKFLRGFDLDEDDEPTDRAIEFVAEQKSRIESVSKKQISSEAQSLAKVLNKGRV